MQLDMHFYGVYAMALAAGVKSNVAKTIAFASQFVDDATESEMILLENQTCILPAMTSHRPIDYQNTIPEDQWKVWVPFHFFPGGESSDGSLIEKLRCRKDSQSA